MEEVMLHELKKSEVGLDLQRGGGFMAKEGDASLQMLMLNRASWAVGVHVP
jgi:hypothetical protein